MSKIKNEFIQRLYVFSVSYLSVGLCHVIKHLLISLNLNESTKTSRSYIYALTNFRNYPEQTPLFNVIQKLTRISEKTVELSGRQLRHNL